MLKQDLHRVSKENWVWAKKTVKERRETTKSGGLEVLDEDEELISQLHEVLMELTKPVTRSQQLESRGSKRRPD